jgi:hypothetical protein
MPRLKVLFADDQIPDENISDTDIKTELKKKHPDWDEGFINAFPIMRRAVETLRLADYDVTLARTHKEALDLVKDLHFDIAIIDLGWYADESIPYAQRAYYGWKISESIEEADKKLKSKPTLQIIHSNRFETEPSIGIQAADEGKLPLFKIYGEAGHQALKASVKFIEQHLTSPSVQEQFCQDDTEKLRRINIQFWMEPLNQQKQWFNLTFVFVALSISLLIAGAIGAIFWNLQVGILTSISSIMTGAISSLLYAQLQRAQKKVEESREKIEQQYKENLERFYASSPTNTSPSPNTR